MIMMDSRDLIGSSPQESICGCWIFIRALLSILWFVHSFIYYIHKNIRSVDKMRKNKKTP